jgi:hypothetical protein
MIFSLVGDEGESEGVRECGDDYLITDALFASLDAASGRNVTVIRVGI